jgi:hypothetical protein
LEYQDQYESLERIRSCLFCLFFEQAPSQKDWRGLVPLKSTRADVERLLGPPDVNANNELITYYQPDTTVNTWFSTNPHCKEKLQYESWDVPADTVTSIRIGLKNPVPINETGIDLTKFKQVRGDSDVGGHFYYTNVEDGFSYEVGQNFLASYIYAPGIKQSKLRCPAINRHL